MSSIDQRLTEIAEELRQMISSDNRAPALISDHIGGIAPVKSCSGCSDKRREILDLESELRAASDFEDECEQLEWKVDKLNRDIEKKEEKLVLARAAARSIISARTSRLRKRAELKLSKLIHSK